MRNISAMAAGLAAAALLATGCGKLFGPKTYEDAMKEMVVANAAGDAKKVADLCERAFELADKAGQGGRALQALECHADAASRAGTRADLKAYYKVITAYPKDLGNGVGRYRLRNDYGVALWKAGKEADAIAVLTEALAVYANTARGGPDTYWERLQLVRNLGKMHMKKGPSAEATAFATEWAEEIEGQIGRSGMHYNSRPGAGEALETIADILSANDPARASELRTLAGEEKEGESQQRAASGVGPRCHNVTVSGVRFKRCFVYL